MTGIERLRALADGDGSHEEGNGWFLTAELLSEIADQIERETKEALTAAMFAYYEIGRRFGEPPKPAEEPEECATCDDCVRRACRASIRFDLSIETANACKVHAGVKRAALGANEAFDGQEPVVRQMREAVTRRRAAGSKVVAMTIDDFEAAVGRLEREIDEAVADEAADTLSAYELNVNARWHSAVEEGAESDCKAEYEMISRYWLPRPRFEDGEPVQFSDVVRQRDQGHEFEVDWIEVCEDGWFAVSQHDGVRDVARPGMAFNRPEPPKVLDADGVEIKVGDEVWHEDGTYGTVMEMNGERVIVKRDGHKWWTNAHCSKFTHRRPEPPDTWEQIEADMAKNDVCDYYGRDSGQPTSKRCEGCRGQEHEDCIMAMTSDIVRRCKALAGVE